MSKCRFLTPCGICEIKSMSGIPYECDLQRIGKLEEESKMPVPKFVEDKTYTDKDGEEGGTVIDTDEFKEDSSMKDRIKQAVADEFKYRASHGRPIYTMEEVIYIVSEIIDEVAFEENEAESQNQTPDLDMQMRVIKGDLRYLAEKVNKLSSLLEKQKNKGDKVVQNER